MHRFSGSLQYYLVIIVLEIVIVCLFQDGDANVSPNHVYFAHDLTSFELAHHSSICKLSTRSLQLLSSSHRFPSPFKL